MDLAVIALAEAAQVYRRLPDAGIHLAHVDMQMAAFALPQARQTRRFGSCDVRNLP